MPRHATKAELSRGNTSANKRDKAIGEFMEGVQNEHVGRVAGILASMDVETADEIVLTLKKLFQAMEDGESNTERFLRKVMSKKPLKGRQLAIAVLACLRKDATDGTYELAEQLVAISGESQHALSYALKAVAAANSHPADRLQRFWNEHLEEAEKPKPLRATAAAH